MEKLANAQPLGARRRHSGVAVYAGSVATVLRRVVRVGQWRGQIYLRPESGVTMSLIDFTTTFDANQPTPESPDRICPGLQRRIPPQ